MTGDDPLITRLLDPFLTFAEAVKEIGVPQPTTATHDGSTRGRALTPPPRQPRVVNVDGMASGGRFAGVAGPGVGVRHGGRDRAAAGTQSR
jgi:hypothetical protein